LTSPDRAAPGNGLLLFFRVDDYDIALDRARALAPQLEQALTRDDFTSLCVYSAESKGILQAMEQLGKDLDLANLALYPCVVPDREVSRETMDAALHLMQQMVDRDRLAPPLAM
jgi:hypothetical protein